MTYWSVIYGEHEAWFLKSNFMRGYVKSVLTSLNFRHEDVIHSTSYTDINIRKVEFGAESMEAHYEKKRKN